MNTSSLLYAKDLELKNLREELAESKAEVQVAYDSYLRMIVERDHWRERARAAEDLCGIRALYWDGTKYVEAIQ